METHLLKSLIIFQKERFLSEKKLIKREILADVLKFLSGREVIFITGIRRSGKSSLLYLIAKELLEKGNVGKPNILFINFEDERFINFTYEDFDKLYQTCRGPEIFPTLD